MSVFAVIPVKTLLESKTRLSVILSQKERQALTIVMLEDVLRSVKRSMVYRTVVISSDPAVEELTKNFRATHLAEKKQGLNQAIEQATEWCIQNNANSVMVLPADVPLILPEDINQIVKLGSERCCVVISPSQNGGTNVLFQKPPNLIYPCFGPNSFRKHKTEALHKGIQTNIYRSERVATDIDSPKDLEKLLKIKAQTMTHQFLKRIKAHERLKLTEVGSSLKLKCFISLLSFSID
jgi:2-phospho-L-lactate guanylyltransferase